MKVELEAGVGVAGGYAFIEIAQKEEQPPQQRRHGIRGHTLSQGRIGMPGDSKARDRRENPEAKEAREAKAGV